MSFDRRRDRVAVGLCVAVVLVAALQSASSAAHLVRSEATPEVSEAQAAPPPSPPAVTITPQSGLEVAPLNAVRVTATSGRLTDVQMTNEAGRVVAGAMAPDGAAWWPDEPLGYGRTYTVSATARGTDATTLTKVSEFSTVVPDEQATVSLNTTLGTRLTDGATYGVGTVIVAQFDTEITDRASAERQLKVTTSPPVQGAWMWVNDRKAHWRPKEYFPAGTKVSVHANLYGADLGGGVYGADDTSVDFVIGPRHVTIADDLTKQVSVFSDGQLVRTMPTSMGRGGTETVGGQTIAFWTQPGVYTVMEKQNPVIMDSSTYGLPVGSSSGYRLSVPYAVRISTDGIYLHQLESTVWAQGNTNVSSGCLNLSAENAKWFYEFSRPGDVVEVRNTGGAPLQQSQNGDWSVPWESWLAGSALARVNTP
ncbi:L,D-transpeptidase [Mycolicibacterium mengxianglii]|uniref:L,D-transpeptidase n=1 Tax=Mycolicibacterium mengxianglii TaxID=2736649 RepID=UPI0018EF2BA9|nr:Ig-like domain-containing protein [Mycolicibacterium mengxianglii]